MPTHDVPPRGPEPLQPRLLSLELPTPEGAVRYAARAWGEAPSPAVVCVHGLSRNASDFDELAQALAPAFRVLAIDMPGRGASPPLADAERYEQPTYLAIANHAIDALDLGPVHWVGTSMGGLLGMALAAAQPARVRSLVLNDIGAELDGAELRRLRMEAADSPRFENLRSAEDYFRERYAAFGPLSDARWAHLARHGVRRGPDGLLGLAFDARAIPQGTPPARLELWSTWERVACPALIIRGGRSALLSREVCERMVAQRPGSHWLEMPEAGHAPDLHGPERIGPVVRFLKGDMP